MRFRSCGVYLVGYAVEVGKHVLIMLLLVTSTFIFMDCIAKLLLLSVLICFQGGGGKWDDLVHLFSVVWLWIREGSGYASGFQKNKILTDNSKSYPI